MVECSAPKVRESEVRQVPSEMRRQDRAMPLDECARLLDRTPVGRIATTDASGAPYVVPMNFVHVPLDGTIFLHCATSGQLLENLAVNSRVCFEVDEPGDVIATGGYACDTSQLYKSVICFGTARVIQDGPEKHQALDLFVQKYVDRLMPDREYEPEMVTIDTTVAISISVEKMTGKQRI